MLKCVGIGEDTISDNAGSRSPYTSCYDEVHSPHFCIWDLPIEGVPFVPYERHVAPLSLSAIEEILHGTIWSLISPLLTTDDVVRCRTIARRWNAGCRSGELGDIFFEFLENDPFVRHRHHNAQCNKLCTLLKKCDPFLDSVRQWGLHAHQAAAVPNEVSFSCMSPDLVDTWHQGLSMPGVGGRTGTGTELCK